MMNEPVSKIMTRDLITVSPEDTLDKARALFAEKRFHHLLVVEKDLLKGLITTSDLLWLDEPSSNYKNIKISDVMTRKLATLEPTDKIGSAAQIFLYPWLTLMEKLKELSPPLMSCTIVLKRNTPAKRFRSLLYILLTYKFLIIPWLEYWWSATTAPSYLTDLRPKFLLGFENLAMTLRS
jgi:acetoin utilization protein AcuB